MEIYDLTKKFIYQTIIFTIPELQNELNISYLSARRMIEILMKDDLIYYLNGISYKIKIPKKKNPLKEYAKREGLFGDYMDKIHMISRTDRNNFKIGEKDIMEYVKENIENIYKKMDECEKKYTKIENLDANKIANILDAKYKNKSEIIVGNELLMSIVNEVKNQILDMQINYFENLKQQLMNLTLDSYLERLYKAFLYYLQGLKDEKKYYDENLRYIDELNNNLYFYQLHIVEMTEEINALLTVVKKIDIKIETNQDNEQTIKTNKKQSENDE